MLSVIHSWDQGWQGRVSLSSYFQSYISHFQKMSLPLKLLVPISLLAATALYPEPLHSKAHLSALAKLISYGWRKGARRYLGFVLPCPEQIIGHAKPNHTDLTDGRVRETSAKEILSRSRPVCFAGIVDWGIFWYAGILSLQLLDCNIWLLPHY